MDMVVEIWKKKNKTHPVIKDVSEALCYPTLAKEDALWLR